METTLKRTERVVENLNRALHHIFAVDPQVFLIGEDILDPYGGAFKVAKGLSSNYPDRVLTTPISEEAIVGIGGGLALCGNKPIVEIMFGDFIALAFDQILNFASKSVSMYGTKLDLNMIVRCAVGGNRGYGPTHSQSLQKHFVGIPNLYLFELSPLHDNIAVFEKLVNLTYPCIFFEDKVLYTQRIYTDGLIDDLFSYEFLDSAKNFARIYADSFEENNCLLISPGGLVPRCLAAARELFIDWEIETQIIVPSQLYPFELETIIDLLTDSTHIFIVEDSVAGGTWGSEVAHQIYSRLWGKLKNPVKLVHSKNSIIPSSAHLEKQVIVQKEDICNSVKEAVLYV
ncbi:alpha-ketoacid dehydrogenase subunit beta [Nostoc muscorum FACHB-395]|nr:alpha-ketoacid dehydrogenase subunit beta [Desmonostoc muscorum FACHB-395]